MILPAVEIETAPNPRHTVLWLHGLGADGHDFEPIVPALVDPAWLPLRFVFPHAPVRPITLNGGMAMRGWYDIVSLDLAQREDEAGVRESISHVIALIAREAERGVAPERLILAGFSQGGAIALAAGLRHAKTLAGVIALSTYMPITATFAAERHLANAATPIFMAHGRYDPIVPAALGRASCERLRALGADVDWHDYPIAHHVSPDEIADLRRWLGARLAA